MSDTPPPRDGSSPPDTPGASDAPSPRAFPPPNGAKPPSAAREEPLGLIAWMANNPIAANLLMVLLLAGGIWTALRMQKEVFPEFLLDQVQVLVTYPGATPEEVEKGVILPVEEAVRAVQGIKETVSTAREGSGTIAIELLAGVDRTLAFQDIDQAISRIRTFPEEAEQPEVRLMTAQREVMEVGIYGPIDVYALRQLGEQIRDQFLSDPAITQVDLGNVPSYVTHVEIPQRTLRKYGLTLGQVADLIRASSQDIPAGAVRTDAGEILLRMHERKQWANEFAKIIVLSSDAGTTVALGDIATITDGFEEYGFHSQFNEQPSIELNVFRVGDQSPLEVAAAVHRLMDEIGPTLPPGVQLRVANNSAQDFRDRLGLLQENGFWGAVIVFFILALFLEMRLAFWVMTGMIISFVGGLLFLPLLGVSINMISMFGFVVVLGVVVDDAIVIGENVYDARATEANPLRAAISGTRDVARPVIFSILTTVVAFVPLLFIPGTMGKYWWPMPVVVIVILLVSLMEALFVLPAHLGHAGKRRQSGWARFLHERQQAFARLVNGFVHNTFNRILKLALYYRYVTMSLALSLFLVVGGFGYSGHMGMIMMPEVAADEIEAGVRLPVGTTPEQAARVALDITASTRRMFDEYDLYQVALGVKTNVRRENFIDVEIVMKPPDEREMDADELIELWRNHIGDIAGVEQITFEAERGPGGARQDISIDLSHSDLDVLERASRTFLERVTRYADTRDVTDNYDKGKMQFDLELLPQARSLGLTPQDVGQQVRDSFFGALALRQLRGTSEIEVRVKLPEEERKELRSFENFIVRTPEGAEVPLHEVAQVSETEAFQSITRRNGRRVVSVNMDVEPKNAMGRVIDALENEELPDLRADFPGITWSFQGMQADMRESTQALWGGFALAMGAIYSLLAIAFRSYSQPFLVMIAIPFGVVGALLGHLLLGYDLSLVSLMGLVALSGVVVNDSLVMLDYANRHRDGRGALETIHEAGLRRFRPILLTTLTTCGGLLPIILERSNQANHLIPMAISLGFGILFAMLIILVLVPCLYVAFDDVSRRWKHDGMVSSS